MLNFILPFSTVMFYNICRLQRGNWDSYWRWKLPQADSIPSMNHHKVRTILNIYRTYSFSLIFECLFCFFFVFQQSSQFGSFYSVWPIFRGSNQIGFELPIIAFFFQKYLFRLLDSSVFTRGKKMKLLHFFSSFTFSVPFQTLCRCVYFVDLLSTSLLYFLLINGLPACKTESNTNRNSKTICKWH